MMRYGISDRFEAIINVGKLSNTQKILVYLGRMSSIDLNIDKQRKAFSLFVFLAPESFDLACVFAFYWKMS
jgi:hypothetical protein